MIRSGIAALAACLALAACDRSDPPSNQLKKAVKGAVEEVSGPAVPALAEGPLAPRDACKDVKGAAEFRRSLAQAVEARDADALAALAAPDIHLDFGGGSGRALLRERLVDEDYALWEELDALLDLGCAPGPAGGIVIPWLFAQEIDAADAYTGMVVTGEKVPIRATAKPDAEERRKISWDVVELVGGLKPDKPFQQIRTRDGTVGFVATERLRSLIDYRLLAVSKDGRWTITALIAGD